MRKEEKLGKVRELTERFQGSTGAVFTDFRGLTVKDATEMRRALHGAGGTFAVVKNTLTRLAATETGLGDVVGRLEGPTAIAFVTGDAVAGAEALLEMSSRFATSDLTPALIK